MDTDVPEIKDDEKTILQIVSELRDEIAGLKHEVEEAKQIPSTKEAQSALESISKSRATADSLIVSLELSKKNASTAQAQAEASNESVSALLKAAKDFDLTTRKTLESAVADFQKQIHATEDALADSKKKLEEQQGRVEALIPGATSAKLASAFKDRKDQIAEGNSGWVVLLVLAALGLVAVGIVSIVSPGDHFWTTLPARAIVVIGLFFIEEFARRNYNIKMRLSESYGYKEVLSRSFYGYKNEIKGMKVPLEGPGGQSCEAEALLVKSFLDALSDEPGRSIFDKEKSPALSERLLTKLVDAKADDNSLLSKFVCGNVLAKVTWPIVVLFGIGVLGACLIIYLNQFD